MATTDHVRDETQGVIKIRENNTKVQRENMLLGADKQLSQKRSKHSLYTLEQKVMSQNVFAYEREEQSRLERKKKHQAEMAEYWRKQHEEKISLEINEQKKMKPMELAYNKKVLQEMRLISEEQSDYADMIA